jgi:glycosyltransferase involved in cell wall biosynthesis
MRVNSPEVAGWPGRAEPAARLVKNDEEAGGPAAAVPPRPGHVLIVVENLPMGIDHRVRKQVADLIANGYRLSVVTRADPANDRYREMPGINVLEYPSPAEPRGKAGYLREYGMSLFYAAVLSLAARSQGEIDVVQFCQPPDIYFALGWILRRLGMKVVCEQRDLMPELFAAKYGEPGRAVTSALRWLERRTQRVAHRTLCTNQTARRRMIEAGADPEHVTIVGNGPVLSRVRAAVPNPALRGGHKYLCCWIGKMGRQDRLDLLLRCIEYIVRDLRWTECGFAILGDGECLDEARAETVRLGLQTWVQLPGWLPENQVFSYLASADLGLDTALQDEISPVKIIEYMAFGLPFVAFDVRETRAMGAGASALAAPADVPGYAQQVVALLGDAPRRAALGATGRERVRAELAWERQSAAYIDVIRRLTAQARADGYRSALSPMSVR